MVNSLMVCSVQWVMWVQCFVTLMGKSLELVGEYKAQVRWASIVYSDWVCFSSPLVFLNKSRLAAMQFSALQGGGVTSDPSQIKDLHRFRGC